MTPERAKARARSVYPTSPGLRSAFCSGAAARRAGKTLRANPYPTRLRRDPLTGRWSRAPGWTPVWATAWSRGYLAS